MRAAYAVHFLLKLHLKQISNGVFPLVRAFVRNLSFTQNIFSPQMLLQLDFFLSGFLKSGFLPKYVASKRLA